MALPRNATETFLPFPHSPGKNVPLPFWLPDELDPADGTDTVADEAEPVDPSGDVPDELAATALAEVPSDDTSGDVVVCEVVDPEFPEEVVDASGGDDTPVELGVIVGGDVSDSDDDLADDSAV